MPTVTIINPISEIKTDNKLRVAAYCRVSSNSADQQNSYAVQLAYYGNKFSDSETETLVEIYADEGISGTRDDKRAEFQRMINDCRKGKIDRIYAKSISRFARNTRDCLKYIRELKSLGITIFFEKECIDTAKITDEMMITIMGGLAQEESVSISQNMQWSIRKRMQNGTYIASNQPYGYDKLNGRLVINEAEAEIVRRIFNEYLSGFGLNSICKNLNADGIIMGKSGIEWKKKAVRYILTNEKYMGDCLWQKSYTENVFPFKKPKNGGEADQYYVADHHEPIISRETFESVQELLKKRSEEFGHTEFRKYPLTMKIQCGNCGRIFKRKEGGGKVIWVCQQHDLNAKLCECKGIDQNEFYDAFIRLFNKLLLNYKTILIPLQRSLQELKIKKHSGNLNVAEIHRSIIQLREQSHIISNLRTKGFLTETKYQEHTAEIRRKIAKNQKDLKLLTHSDDDSETLEQIEMLVDFFECRNEIMSEFEIEAFEFMIEKIIVKEQKTLEFHLLGGLKLTEKL